MFLERHQVRQHLAGMRAPRQPVDYRHGGKSGELQPRGGGEGGGHEGIGGKRQPARGGGNGLAAAELHFGARQHDRFPAELAHADVERHPGSGRGLFENHRQRLALERLVRLLVCLQLRLHGDAGDQHVAQLFGRKLTEIEKMAQSLAHCPAARFSCLPESVTQARSRRATDSSISVSVTINGGSNRTTFSPAPTVSSFSSRSAVTRSPDGTTAFRPINRPSPRTSASTPGWRSTTEASFCLSSSDIFCACSKNPGASMTSSTALAAATASGLPPKVEPCEPGVMPEAASAVARQAPIGKPPPSAFANGITSGVTPSRRCANSSPVRPMPVCTSSNASSRPRSSQSWRNAR